jgi:hypothetical protein
VIKWRSSGLRPLDRLRQEISQITGHFAPTYRSGPALG